MSHINQSNWIYDFEEKALGGMGRRARKKVRKILKRPKYDGDSDGFITNPFTGRDEIPWFKDRETPDEALKRFFGGKLPDGLGANMFDKDKVPHIGKSKVNMLKRGDILPDGFDKGIDRGGNSQFQIAKIEKLDGTKTRLTVVDLNDPKRLVRTFDVPNLLDIPNVRRPAAGPTRTDQSFPSLATSRARGQNLGPYDLRPEGIQKFPNMPSTSPRPARQQGQQQQLPFAQQAPKPQTATPSYQWPRGDDGRLVPVDKLSDDDLREAKKFFDNLSDSDKQKPAVQNLKNVVDRETASRAQGSRSAMDAFNEAQARSQQIMASAPEAPSASSDNDEFDVARRSLWDRFKQWVPSLDWKGGRRESFFNQDREAIDRWRSDYLKVDIIESDEEPGKYAILGHIYDPSTGEWSADFFDGYEKFDTVADAMKYVEDLEDELDRQERSSDALGPFDEDFPWPEENSISKTLEPDPSAGPDWKKPTPNEPAKNKKGKLLGKRKRSHNFIADALERARDLFRERWTEKRTNANLEDRIEFNNDRRLELLKLNEQMFNEWEDLFGGQEVMNEAWYKSPEDFAKWAREQGIVDTISEGLQLHEEIMDAWDQMSEDSAEISEMIGELDAHTKRLINSWNDKNSRAVEGFGDTYEEHARVNRF